MGGVSFFIIDSDVAHQIDLPDSSWWYVLHISKPDNTGFAVQFLLSLPETEEYVTVGLRSQLGSVEIGRKLNSALEDIVYESDILDNALRINVNDPLGSYNTKTWRCYTSAGTT